MFTPSDPITGTLTNVTLVNKMGMECAHHSASQKKDATYQATAMESFNVDGPLPRNICICLLFCIVIYSQRKLKSAASQYKANIMIKIFHCNGLCSYLISKCNKNVLFLFVIPVSYNRCYFFPDLLTNTK